MRSRGSTLIEVMIAVALLGISSVGVMNAVLGYRTRVAAVRRGYSTLACAQAEVERLRQRTPEALRHMAARIEPDADVCTAPMPTLAIREVPRQAGLFVLTAVVAPALGPSRTISLPFLAVEGRHP